MNIVYSCDISPKAQIGQDTVFMHNGLGVVIGDDARIGKNAVIVHQTTIGGNGRDKGMPVIGDNVYIGVGAKILGPIIIGDNCVIGANSVVLENIPASSLVAGNPGKIVKSNIDRSVYYTA